MNYQDPLTSGGMSMLQCGSVNIYTWWLSSWLLSALLVPAVLWANGDLAFRGCSTDCSLGLNFWSENLLSTSDITGEACLILHPIRAGWVMLEGQKESGDGKKKKSNCGSKQMMWTVAAALNGCFDPYAVSPVVMSHQVVTHWCHRSSPCVLSYWVQVVVGLTECQSPL